MIYKYIACGFNKSQPCVIVSWDTKFQKSEEWLTWPSTKNLDQPYYRILGPKIEYGKLYVAQGNRIKFFTAYFKRFIIRPLIVVLY